MHFSPGGVSWENGGYGFSSALGISFVFSSMLSSPCFFVLAVDGIVDDSSFHESSMPLSSGRKPIH